MLSSGEQQQLDQQQHDQQHHEQQHEQHHDLDQHDQLQHEQQQQQQQSALQGEVSGEEEVGDGDCGDAGGGDVRDGAQEQQTRNVDPNVRNDNMNSDNQQQTQQQQQPQEQPQKTISPKALLHFVTLHSSLGAEPSTPSPTATNNNNNNNIETTAQTFREARDHKVIGLKNYGLSKATYAKRQRMECTHKTGGGTSSSMHSRRTTSHYHSNPAAQAQANTDGSVFSLPEKSIEELEDEARKFAVTNPFYLMFLGNMSAFKVMAYFLVTMDTLLNCLLTSGLTCYWYFTYLNDDTWNGGSLDFILLAFAVVSPISAALGMAFTRRERALIAIADFRSFAYHLYLAHATWDWPEKGGRAGAAAANQVNWIEHCDAVLAQLIGLGDELSRFLSLPTATKSRHRMTRQGRREAARIMEVSYHLFESMGTQRMTRLLLYSERIKKIGLPAGEISRMRQYERFLTDNLEQLRLVKLYRTPQTLRSFARIFILLLPPFYAPTFAQVARDVKSLGVGIAFGIIVALGLSALFEGLEILEDPFTAYLTLDGIDVREEFEVLHFAQLLSTRRLIFPDAPNYPPGRRAALIGYHDSSSKRHMIGLPPIQGHHERYQHQSHRRVPSRVPSQVNVLATNAMATKAMMSDDNNSTNTASDEEELTLLDLDDFVDMELGTTLMGEDDTGSVAPSLVRRETAFSYSNAVGEDDATVLTRPRFHRRTTSGGTGGPSTTGSLSASARLSRRRRWEQ